MEALVVEVTKDPEYIRNMDPANERLLNTIRLLSRPSAAGLNLTISNQRYSSLVLSLSLSMCGGDFIYLEDQMKMMRKDVAVGTEHRYQILTFTYHQNHAIAV